MAARLNFRSRGGAAGSYPPPPDRGPNSAKNGPVLGVWCQRPLAECPAVWPPCRTRSNLGAAECLPMLPMTGTAAGPLPTGVGEV